MGWKLSLIAVADQESELRPPEWLGAEGYDLERAEHLVLGEALYPSPGVGVTRWNGHLMMLSDDFAQMLLDLQPPPSGNCRLLEAFPDREMYVASLHSVSEYYSYAVYSNGSRTRYCTGYDGLHWVCQQGEPFDWEASYWENGDRSGGGGEFDGEGAVMHLLSIPFGCRLDQGPEELFKSPVLRYRKSSFLCNLAARLKSFWS